MSKGARTSARQRLATERAQQAQRDKRRRTMLISLAAVAAIIVVVVVVVVVRSSGSGSPGPTYTGAIAPATRQSDGSIVMAMPGVTSPVLEIFEDFQCPSCKAFETTNGDNTKRLAAAGKVKVVYRPFRLFTQDPLKSNSYRAANAALCAPAANWVRYHDTLYRNQPAEGSVGFKNPDLITWAGQVGITTAGTFSQCVNGDQKRGQVDVMTQYAEQSRKVDSTPTLYLNGTELGQDATFTSSGFEDAISAAR